MVAANRVFAAVAVASCLGLAAESRAATVSYYYAGGLAQVSNTPDPADRPAFNTGQLTIDRDLLAGGTSLANRTISYTPYDDDYDPSAAAVSYAFALGTGTEEVSYSLTFDANENLSSWNFRSFFMITPSDWNDFAVNMQGDRYVSHYGDTDFATWRANAYLTDLGLQPGTAKYDAQYCGGWAGAGQDCNEYGEAAPAWGAVLLALGGGQWFRDDLAGFMDRVQANTLAALAAPPRSYHDISAVPLPAPLALIGAALGALLLLRRNAERPTADSRAAFAA